jgi:hypothetical protein
VSFTSDCVFFLSGSIIYGSLRQYLDRKACLYLKSSEGLWIWRITTSRDIPQLSGLAHHSTLLPHRSWITLLQQWPMIQLLPLLPLLHSLLPWLPWLRRFPRWCPSLLIQYIENNWTDFHEVWYGRYATGDFFKFSTLNFVHSVIPARRMIKFARWDQDDDIHNRLRKRG